MITTICILILTTVNITVGALLLSGKLRLVIIRPQPEPEAPYGYTTSTQPMPKRRGRPRKDAKDGIVTQDLFLPYGLSDAQLHDISEFFKENKDTHGDRIVLHIPSEDGEEMREVPHRVDWNTRTKEELSVLLGGWA